jgi:ABC-type amino acid transport substrate-binding protein
VTSIGYGDYIPITFFGRILAALIIFAGLGIFGVYIAEVSSSLTMRKLRSGIEKQHDLFGKRVATLEGSYAEDATRNLGADVLVTRKIEEAYKKLLNDEVLAVVFDEPVLLYFASHEGKDKVKLVGDLFHPQNYGFAISEGSEMREPINQALLKIIETGEYNILYKKWFGVEL